MSRRIGRAASSGLWKSDLWPLAMTGQGIEPAGDAVVRMVQRIWRRRADLPPPWTNKFAGATKGHGHGGHVIVQHRHSKWDFWFANDLEVHGEGFPLEWFRVSVCRNMSDPLMGALFMALTKLNSKHVTCACRSRQAP